MSKSTGKKSDTNGTKNTKDMGSPALNQRSKSGLASQVLNDNRTSSASKNGKTFYTSDRETDPDLIKANRYLDRAVKAIRNSKG